MNERERLAFVESRDGVAAALEWAARTLRVYRATLARGNNKFPVRRIPMYRRQYVESCLAFRAYIRSARP